VMARQIATHDWQLLTSRLRQTNTDKDSKPACCSYLP
jgi:hypothetical protein